MKAKVDHAAAGLPDIPLCALVLNAHRPTRFRRPLFREFFAHLILQIVSSETTVNLTNEIIFMSNEWQERLLAARENSCGSARENLGGPEFREHVIFDANLGARLYELQR